jgi:hypothetical protein
MDILWLFHTYCYGTSQEIPYQYLVFVSAAALVHAMIDLQGIVIEYYWTHYHYPKFVVGKRLGIPFQCYCLQRYSAETSEWQITL